jgi:hypothetical protein
MSRFTIFVTYSEPKTMITNRPKFLEENLPNYKTFPQGKDFDIDYKQLPPLLNLDFHTLNGILPLTGERFGFIGQNGEMDGKLSTVIMVNPLPEEYAYYESIGVTEFQAIQIVINCFVIENDEDGSIRGVPYSVSLVPMSQGKKIDTWSSGLLKTFDLEQLCQEGGYVFTDFNPFKGWYDGFSADYSLFNKLPYDRYSDCIGFAWGMYFLAPGFDKKDVKMIENTTYSAQVNAKYRRFKTELYFRPFENINPRRIWGCDSPIELFLLQGMYLKGWHPEIQMGIYRTGEVIQNYHKMQESEIWLGQDRLITAADFYFPEINLAIFCDGKEFHNVEKDEAINKKLNDFGISVLRFSGKQISESLPEVLSVIEEKLKK